MYMRMWAWSSPPFIPQHPVCFFFPSSGICSQHSVLTNISPFVSVCLSLVDTDCNFKWFDVGASFYPLLQLLRGLHGLRYDCMCVRHGLLLTNCSNCVSSFWMALQSKLHFLKQNGCMWHIKFRNWRCSKSGQSVPLIILFCLLLFCGEFLMGLPIFAILM